MKTTNIEPTSIKNKIKLITLVIFLLLILTGLVWLNQGVNSNYKTKKKFTILTSLKPLQSITENLIVGTNMNVVIVPKEKKIKEYGRWFKEKHNDTEFSSIAKKADAVIGISSFWKGDPLFPYTRMHNIFAVYIDALQPSNPNLAGVSKMYVPKSSLQNTSSNSIPLENSIFAWMSLSNAAKIAELIALDLQFINPAESTIIQKNLEAYCKKIFNLKTKYEEKLLDTTALSISAFSPDFVYLTDNFNIAVEAYLLKDAYYWTDDDYNFLNTIINDYDSKIFITSNNVNTKIKERIEQQGGVIIKLDNFNTSILKDNKNLNSKDLFLKTMETNLEKIYQAMK